MNNNQFTGIEPAVANPFMTKAMCAEEYRKICACLTKGGTTDYELLLKHAGNAMEALKRKDLLELRTIYAEIKTL